MTDRPGSLSIRSLILMPALITLGITLLRLVGELLNWSPVLFSRAAGGGFALVGISWLPPILGFYFASKLAKEAPAPGGGGLIGSALAGIVLAVGSAMVVGRVLKLSPQGQFPIIILALIVAAWLAYRAWPLLGRVLFAYGLAARIPVVIVMLIAIYANWGTHYDVLPPGLPDPGGPFARWFQIGLVPQLLIWIPFTMVTGALLGGIALLVGGGSRQAVTA